MKARKPWIALNLSFLCPGLGQLYNGNLGQAAWALGLGVMVALASTFFLFESLNKLLVAVAAGLTIDLYFGLQAYFEARRLKEIALKPYNRWWVYLLFTVVLYGLPDGYGLFMPSRLCSFQIPSESMVPNLLVGDRLVADGWSFWRGEPKRADIVVFDYPRDRAVKYVKRLIGLPGDTVELRRGELYLNGKLVPQRRSSTPTIKEGMWTANEFIEELDGRQYKIYRSQPMAMEDYGPIVVPEGKFFVMGDNRDRSNDSRFWGFVPRDHLIARMRYIFFSWAKEEARIRLDRIGQEVN